MIIEAERPDALDPGQTSASVTIIEVDETLSAGADVAAVVESAAGTVVRRLGGLGAYSAVSIRGSSFRQVQVYLDGVPLNPDGSASVNLSELPLSAFSRVEIYRGNAPPSFAAAPIGGVVNLVSGDREVSSGSATYGQYDTARISAAVVQHGEVAGQTSDVLALTEVFTTQGDFGYYTDNGTIYNTFDDARLTRANNDKAQLSAYGRWRLGDDRLRLTVADAFLARQEGLPGHVNIPAGSTRLETTRNITTAQVEGSGGSARWSTRVWRQGRLETYDDREGQIGVGTQWQESRYQTTGVLGHAALAVRPWLLPAVTVTARQDRYVLTDLLLDATEDPRLRYAIGGSLSADAWLADERIKLSPVLQLSFLNNRLLGDVPFGDTAIAPDGEDTIFSADPRLGVLGRPLPGLVVKANAGSYLRPPDFTELFGDRGGVIGSTDLVPEEGWQWDAGLRLEAPENPAIRGAFDAAYFWTHAENQIIFVQNSQRTSVPVNFGETRTDGVELAVTADVLGWLDSQSTATWTRSENRTDSDDVRGNQLPRIPEWELYQGTSLHWGEWARLGHTFSYTADNYWDATNFFLAAPRAIHGAFLRVGTGRLSAEGSVLNLTDSTVAIMDRNPLSDTDDTPILQPLTDFTGYPLPGRTWLLTLRWSGAPPSSLNAAR
ncbi:MAG: vitamin B12 transporter [Myxococcota bacterium]|jgi:vitamin B12 transporter